MNLKNKIILIIGFCIIMSIGSFFIIKMMFDRFEDQLFQKCRIEALTGSRVMSEVAEFMIDNNIISLDNIFDTNYVKIKGTNPPKYHTKYDLLFDKYIQKIQDEYLEDKDLIFSILIDKNGYVPTHNSRFSKPESSDKEANLKYSRSKRNFSYDPTVKKALQIKDKKVIKFFYTRDTGESMWIIGSPVFIKNKHWGAFLLGVSLEGINIMKNQMIILISSIMFIFLSLTILALLAIMPRKLFESDIKSNIINY